MSIEFIKWIGENPELLKRVDAEAAVLIWNAALEAAARKFAFNDFEAYAAEHVVRLLRSYKA
jgi:hypothetical protein